VKRAYLTTEEVAELLRCSVRSVHGLTAAGRLPSRKLAGMRRVLYRPEELAQYLDGAELETIATADGGRIVRVKLNGTST